MHYYKRNIGDYHKKAGRLSMLEHGAYTLLLDACYDRERFPTLEEALDWAWARTDEEEAAVKFVLKKFFTEIDGVYVQNHIQEELDAYKAKAETNARIAKEREEKRKKGKQGVNDLTPVVNESCNSGDEPPPNHKPLTNNHKPITSISNTHTLSADENQNESWKPDSNILINVIRESVGIQAQKVLDMPDYEFHLGNFNAHWENKIDLTENQRTRKFAQWLIQEFKKAKSSGQPKNQSKSNATVSRNVNDAHGDIPDYVPAVDNVNTEGLV
ncbi:YdaU family protein [uncultured Acinetobacter sp.]|uniref:YdaU family protein n=1 Tax=uncultured Acinetobacter sp. TaxID=165433 RepID=UPI00258A1354|nr:YdaU family protein [uncultured Acinetobacter sp.]